MPCERRALETADQQALIAECADRLRAGELCVLPTETVYGLTVLPSQRAAVERVRELKGRAVSHPFTSHLARHGDLHDLCAATDPRVERLVQRYWPGPLTVIVEGKDGETIGTRLPAHAFTREVIAACGEPLWMSSVNRTGEPPLTDPDAICAQFGEHVALVVDDGPSNLGISSTVVKAVGPTLEVLREGILTTDEVLRAAAKLVVFVCTGNTCRSPLAEVLARDLVARTIGCEPTAVLAHGYAFGSAGTSTLAGMPASGGSLAAGKELDLDLGAHRSQPVDAVTMEAADHIYCLSDNHRHALLHEFPQCADKIALLRPDGRDIRDPFGSELKTYQRVRDEIRAAVGKRVKEWIGGGS